MTALGWAGLAVGGAAAAVAVARDARALAELWRRIPLIHRQMRQQLDRDDLDGARERGT